MNTGLAMGAVAASVTFAVMGTALVVRPLRRLGPRIRPYTAATRVELGLRPDLSSRIGPAPVADSAGQNRLVGSISRGLDRLRDSWSSSTRRASPSACASRVCIRGWTRHGGSRPTGWARSAVPCCSRRG